MTKMMSVGLFILVALFSGLQAMGNAWDSQKPYQGPRKDIITLMITGNYTESRLLAELIQVENQQPMILLPPTPGGKIYFVPAKGQGLEIQDEKFTKFVKFLNPKQILIIGDQRYVPEAYVARINKNQTSIRINNEDWLQIAVSAGRILDLPNLAGDYERLYRQLKGGKLFNSGRDDLGNVPAAEPVGLDKPALNPLDGAGIPAQPEPVLINKDEEEGPVVPK